MNLSFKERLNKTDLLPRLLGEKKKKNDPNKINLMQSPHFESGSCHKKYFYF